MSDTPASNTINADALLLALRRKQGTWVDWGKACQQLQKANYSQQSIFEETGFEPTHQNQVIVAAQVYATLESATAPEPVLAYFQRKGSDILYEFRVLVQQDRVAAADFALEKSLDADEAKDLARAMKEFSRLSNVPESFSATPGDAIAYQCWIQARQKSDLQDRSRLIAKGLKAVQSDAARGELEKLLTDFAVVKTRSAPVMPVYRLESEIELPRIVPLAGTLPTSAEVLNQLPQKTESGAFGAVQLSGNLTWVPIPGWQSIFKASDPVAFLCDSAHLPIAQGKAKEDVLVICDRAEQDWDDLNYFLIAQDDQLDVQWTPEPPTGKVEGRLLLVVRSKRILDENVAKEFWLLDE